MLCQFLLYNNVNQLLVYIWPLPPEPSVHLHSPSRLSRSSQSTELSSLCYTAASHQYLFHMWWCSPSLSHLPLPLLPTHLFPMSVSLFLPCKQFHLYHISRLCMYVLISNICFSLSDLLHSVKQSLGPSTSLQMIHFCSF